MQTKKPSAIIYGWNREGEIRLTSDIYFEENLYDEVVLYALSYNDIFEDFSRYNPDVIITIGFDLESIHPEINRRWYRYDSILPDNIIANDVVCQTVFRNCMDVSPYFSIFTPTYKTGERILRTYEGLKSQTFPDWEWIIVDDSPDDETWNLIQEISKKDFRVKPHKILPVTGGNVGLAKNRAAMLGSGKWLVELDHDDFLLSGCLEESKNAAEQYPDAGFIYSDVCELYEDGEFRKYRTETTDDWYGNPDNYFCFGYAGNTFTEVDGKQYLQHHYPSINPLTIRFNISMPNHARIWRSDVYKQVNGHNQRMPVADDFELIVKTFLVTRFIHVKKLLYLQYNNRNSTVDNNAIDINRRARLIRDFYDQRIHQRIQDLGKFDWNWNETENSSYKTLKWYAIPRFYDAEEVMNYDYE